VVSSPPSVRMKVHVSAARGASVGRVIDDGASDALGDGVRAVGADPNRRHDVSVFLSRVT
jgi:hypothetical protein